MTIEKLNLTIHFWHFNNRVREKKNPFLYYYQFGIIFCCCCLFPAATRKCRFRWIFFFFFLNVYVYRLLVFFCFCFIQIELNWIVNDRYSLIIASIGSYLSFLWLRFSKVQALECNIDILFISKYPFTLNNKNNKDRYKKNLKQNISKIKREREIHL